MNIIATKFELRKYQQKIVDEIHKDYDNNKNNLLVQSPPRSGKTVVMAFLAKEITDQGKRVLFTVHVREVLSAAYNTFKDVGVDMNLVDFFSPIKVANRIKKETFNKDRYDLILIDEAHHSKANTYMKIRSYFKPKHFLFFTATPTRQDGQGFEDIAEDIILGPSVKNLIKWGNLATFDYYTIPLNDKDQLKVGKNGDYTEKSIAKSVSNIDPKMVFDQYKKYGDGKQGLLYAARVAQSKELADYFNKHGIPSAHIGSDTPPELRKKYVDDYKQKKIKVIMNVSVFTEGVDLPSAEIALLLRPTQSLSLYLQFAMRVLTQYNDKHAIIVDLVGAALKLGLPDYDHHWTLAAQQVEDNSYNLLENTMQNCPKCHKTFYNEDGLMKIAEEIFYTISCPYCGQVLKSGSFDKDLNLDDDNEIDDVAKAYDENPQIQKVKSKEEFMKAIYARKQLKPYRNFYENYLIAYAKNKNGDANQAFIQAAQVPSELYTENSIRLVGDNFNISKNTIEEALKIYNSAYQAILMGMKYTYVLKPVMLLQKILLRVQMLGERKLTVKQNMTLEINELKKSSLQSSINRNKFEQMKMKSLIFQNYLENLTAENVDKRTIDYANRIGFNIHRDLDIKQIALTDKDLQDFKDFGNPMKRYNHIPDIIEGNISDISFFKNRMGKYAIRVTIMSGSISFYNFIHNDVISETLFKFRPREWHALKSIDKNMQIPMYGGVQQFMNYLQSYVGWKVTCKVIDKQYKIVWFKDDYSEVINNVHN